MRILIMLLFYIGMFWTDPITIIQTEVSSFATDEIQLKQREMRDTTVLVRTHRGSGSGTIVDCLEIDDSGVFKYRVLTNAHVTRTRFVTTLLSVNSLTGKVEIEEIDIGCEITVFDHQNMDLFQYKTEVIAENIRYDLALLLFQTTQKLATARLASDNMLDRVRVFDEVFTMGCQLGRDPIPTTGIISQILTGNNGEKQWVIYGNTAQVTPGTSGGALFKKYNNHYCMIGIPFMIAVANNGQFVPHLSYAISIDTARDFINQNVITNP